MATTKQKVTEAITASTAAGGTPEDQTDAAIAADIPPPSTDTAAFLWKALVLGLIGLIFVSLVGILWAILDGNADTDPDVPLTAFTALVTGLLGLFVKSPTSG